MSDRLYAGVSAGTVEYDQAAAAVDIDELIEALEQAREDGATHVVGLSGNYRGAQWTRLGLPRLLDDDEDEF